MAPDICPQCGSEVPRNAKACPECGSDERTGWSEEAWSQGLDLADEEFDYADFVEQEFGRRKTAKPRGVSWFWWAVALAVVGAFAALLLAR